MGEKMRNQLIIRLIAWFLLLCGSGWGIEMTGNMGLSAVGLVFQYTPKQEPIGAVDLRIRLKKGIEVNTVYMNTDIISPWSQVKPVFAREGDELRISAIAPAIQFSQSNKSFQMFTAELGFSSGFPTPPTFNQVVDSAWVVRALDPSGKELAAVSLQAGATRNAEPNLKNHRHRVTYHQVQRLHSFSFALAKKSAYRAFISDAFGKRVKSLGTGVLDAGHQRITWDSRGANGQPAFSGVYFIQIEIDNQVYSRKVRVVR